MQGKLLKSLLEWVPEVLTVHVNDDGDKPKQGIYELFFKSTVSLKIL